MSNDEFPRRRGYRAERIERFVAEAFEYTLLPALEDPRLAGLHVFSVETTNNLACVRVTLRSGSEENELETAEVEAALEKAAPRLRMELAESLRIKRIPLLRLSYLPLPLNFGNEKGGGA